MKKINLEIRDGNGGGDAKLLVMEMQGIYMKTAKNNDIECSIIDVREGFVHLCL
jgi:protein subunit release factor A